MKNPKILALISGLFFIFEVLSPGYLGANPPSRIAAMSAFCRNGSFEIGEYVNADSQAPLSETHWTSDWSRTPDGLFYSNKAPGPILIGTPLTCLIQWVFLGMEMTVTEQHRIMGAIDRLLSIILQLIPFMLGSFFLIRNLGKKLALSPRVQIVSLSALLMGNTSSLFMNAWFGHGMVATAMVLSILFYLEARPFWVGFSLCLAISADYSSALFIPAFILGSLLQWRDAQMPWSGWRMMWKRIFIGSLIPAVAVLLYQWVCFGSPFLSPYHFQNPIFVDVTDESSGFLGIFHAWPSIEVIGSLLFSPERGLLFTQPWTLLAIGLGVWKMRVKGDLGRAIVLIPLVCFFGLLLLNASFGQWHGGGSTGPRYLAGALPLLVVPFAWGLKSLEKQPLGFWLAAISVFISVAFTGGAMGTSTTFGLQPLWPAISNYSVWEPHRFWFRASLWIPLLTFMIYATLTQTEQQEFVDIPFKRH